MSVDLIEKKNCSPNLTELNIIIILTYSASGITFVKYTIDTVLMTLYAGEMYNII